MRCAFWIVGASSMREMCEILWFVFCLWIVLFRKQFFVGQTECEHSICFFKYIFVHGFAPLIHITSMLRLNDCNSYVLQDHYNCDLNHIPLNHAHLVDVEHILYICWLRARIGPFTLPQLRAAGRDKVLHFQQNSEVFKSAHRPSAATTSLRPWSSSG